MKVLLLNFARRSIKPQNRLSPLIPMPRSRITNTIRRFISKALSIVGPEFTYEIPHSHDIAILNPKPRELVWLNLMSFLQILQTTKALIALKTEKNSIKQYLCDCSTTISSSPVCNSLSATVLVFAVDCLYVKWFPENLLFLGLDLDEGLSWEPFWILLIFVALCSVRQLRVNWTDASTTVPNGSKIYLKWQYTTLQGPYTPI